jgi:nucleotide-binding universal stress UspA family protein
MTAAPILVATDFSARADRAVDRALFLGKRFGVPVRVLHALDGIEAGKVDWNELDRRMQESVGEAECEVEFAYPEGSPPRALAREAQESEALVLVMAPARYNSLGDYILGTAVDHVLRATDRPVLVVKERARAPYQSIIAGTDFSEPSAHAIRAAARLFPDVEFHITHGWKVPFGGFGGTQPIREEAEAEDRARLEAFMASLRESAPALGTATASLVHGGPYKAIRGALDAQGGGLVVIGSHGASGFEQATIGSVTSELLRSLPADVLVVSAARSQER